MGQLTVITGCDGVSRASLSHCPLGILKGAKGHVCKVFFQEADRLPEFLRCVM